MRQTASSPRDIEVALVGRPNSGKTSLMMHLTGTGQRPVNFAGSSVERVEASVAVGDRRLRVVDLPGIGSLRPVSVDEEVSVAYLRRGQGPDVICAVLDASKLSVELRFLAALADLGKPVVVALNKSDVAAAEGCAVNAAALAELVQIPVIETDGLRRKGIDVLRSVLADAPERGPLVALPDHPDVLARSVQSSSPPRRTTTDTLDAVLLNRFFGLPILIAVMFAMFQLVFTGAEPLIGWIESAQGALSDLVASAVGPGALRSFLIDGLINGLGSVVVFLPQIILLIALVAVLEASGYMARAAFLLDRLLGRFGLSGRSFVPLATSFACAIPGILASRIIPDERDRIATIVVSPLMSCSARLPVYVVLIGAFFPVAWAGLVLFGLYALGIVTAALVAVLVRRTVLRGGHSPLLMELPAYQPPSLLVVWGQVKSACREFAVLAGTFILVASIVIWFLSYYPRPVEIHQRFEAQRQQLLSGPIDGREAAMVAVGNAERAAYLEQSYLALAGKAVQPVFEPAGFDWRATVGVIAAFPARELIVPTLGVLYSLGEVDAGEYTTEELAGSGTRSDGLREKLRSARRADGRPAYDGAVALALMVFFALCSQCAATLGAIRRETRSWRWPVFTFVYMTAAAWVAAVLVYQVSLACGLGGGS